MRLKLSSKIIQTLSTPSAILDVHFHPTLNQQSSFGVATSTGSIGIYHLVWSHTEDIPEMIHTQTLQYFPEDVLVTTFLWHPNGSSIGMALTTGEICLRPFKSDKTLEPSISGSLTTHDLEAWTLAFSSDGLGVYSGGDDSALKFTELAINHEHHFDDSIEAKYGEVRRMPWSDRKIHGAGVTAILPLHTNDQSNFVLTGSYDDHIRLIHAPVVGRRNVVAEMYLGGGVWRLKRLDSASTPISSGNQTPDNVLLLVSCMHAGARIMSLRKDENKDWQFEVLAKFEEHKSMNYGSDCQPGLNSKNQRTFVTTSFYDRLLCFWRY